MCRRSSRPRAEKREASVKFYSTSVSSSLSNVFRRVTVEVSIFYASFSERFMSLQTASCFQSLISGRFGELQFALSDFVPPHLAPGRIVRSQNQSPVISSACNFDYTEIANRVRNPCARNARRIVGFALKASAAGSQRTRSEIVERVSSHIRAAPQFRVMPVAAEQHYAVNSHVTDHI